MIFQGKLPDGNTIYVEPNALGIGEDSVTLGEGRPCQLFVTADGDVTLYMNGLPPQHYTVFETTSGWWEMWTSDRRVARGLDRLTVLATYLSALAKS